MSNNHRYSQLVTSEHPTFYQRRGKRIFDLGAGVAIGIATLPIQVVIAALVSRKLGSPVLFKQQRPGLNGRPFQLIKFRTMTDAVGPYGDQLPDEDRLTAFGLKLRSTSLDELPEIYNVIRGEMSLVGPRPLLMQYLERYSDYQARRHDVRPGLTGLAQVSGRNAITWEQKFALDVRYTEDVSLKLDLQIILRTVISVALRDGIGQHGRDTVTEFMGSSTVPR